jgi:hypothetical protein
VPEALRDCRLISTSRIIPGYKQEESVLLNVALTCLALGLVVWSLNWTELAQMPIQIYWVFTVGGMLLLLVYVTMRRPARVW